MARLKHKAYLDYAATTPVDSRVEKAMWPYFGLKFGNPGSLHSFGQEAIKAVDLARENIAKAIGLPPSGGFREIIFTGSATEANNLAIRGVLRGQVKNLNIKNKNDNSEFKSGQIERDSEGITPRVIVSSIEHESILETCKDLEKNDGVEVIYLPVSREGAVDLKKLKEALSERTVLVSIMYANNEIGAIQPLSEISRIISDFRKRKLEALNSKFETSSNVLNSRLRKVSDFGFRYSSFPLLHTDAVQALQFLDCNVNNLEVDMMTLSAHKIYGPKGVGALYIGSRAQGIGHSRDKRLNIKSKNLGSDYITPIVTGGGQEFGLRSGTENVPNIVGFSKAVELVDIDRKATVRRVEGLRDYLWKGIKKIYSKAEINGKWQIAKGPPSLKFRRAGKMMGDSQLALGSLPNILNVYFPDFLAEELLVALDLKGVAVSAGSACSARSAEPSYVIKALGYSKERARRSLRFSLGKPTTKKEIDITLKILKNILGDKK